MGSVYEQPCVIYYRNRKEYKLFPGETCLVDPDSKSVEAEKVRGRYCQVIKIWNNGKVTVRYLDTNRCGSRYSFDLIPQKKVAALSSYKLKAK